MNILVTGGASGLGGSISRALAGRPDYTVYFTYARSEAAAKEIEAEFSNTHAIRCDFTNLEELRALVDDIPRLNIDVLVNNAFMGSFIQSHFHKTAPEDFSKAFSENVLPTIEITQAAITAFRKKKFGKVITISTAALVNTPPIGASVYVATKAYVEQLARVWATENTRFNISSNVISPAFMLTAFTGSMDERMVEQIQNNHPLKKLLTTEEVAESVCFLAGAGQQINGLNLVMNAGMNIK